MANKPKVPLGTYLGNGKDSAGNEVSYTMRIMEKKLCWFDYKCVMAHEQESFHAEGQFEIMGDAETPAVKFTIGGLPGQPRVGQEYVFTGMGKFIDKAPVLQRDGVFLTPQADTLGHCAGDIVCNQCGKAIEGQMMKYKEETFCESCFVCSKCSTPLTGAFQKQQDGTRLCSACIPEKICEACGQPIKGTATSVGGKFYHPECFVCAHCGGVLTGGFATKNGEKLCKPCLEACKGQKSPAKVTPAPVSKKPAEEEGKAPSEVISCCICKRPCTSSGEEYLKLPDGRAVHWSCFKCSSCGKAETPKGEAAKSMKTLRGKLDQAMEGTYTCGTCPGASPTAAPNLPSNPRVAHLLPFGCYTGKGPGTNRGEDITYSVRLMEEQDQCWLDYTMSSKIASGSWHAEGKYVEETETGKVVRVKFTVKSSPHGGGPPAGKEYTFEVEKGTSPEVLIVEGLRCSLAGEQHIEIDEYKREDLGQKASAVLETRQAVPKAAVTAESAPLPGEGQDTKVMRGAHGYMDRTELSDAHDIIKTDQQALPGVVETKVMKGGQGIMERTQVDTSKGIIKEAAAPAAPAPTAAVAEAPAAAATPAGCFSLAELQDVAVWKAKGVDASRREEYLADADFQTLFGASKADFASLPKWKRDKQKKDHGLF